MFDLRKLSEEELLSPLMKFINIEAEKPDLSMLENPILPLQNYYPEKPCDLANDIPGGENGWSVLENGIGYISLNISLPHVTARMLYWLLSWQALEPSHYTATHPQLHHSAAVSDIDRLKLLNSCITDDVKCLGYTMFSVEKMPYGLEDVITMYQSPYDFGLKEAGTGTTGINTASPIICANFLRQSRSEDDPQKKWAGILLHRFIVAENRTDMLTRIWLGCRVLRREMKNLLASSNRPDEEYVKMLAEKTAMEWSHIGKILPELFHMMSTRQTYE